MVNEHEKSLLRCKDFIIHMIQLDNFLSPFLITSLFLFISCSILDPQQPAKDSSHEDIKIVVLSDLHYYAPILGTNGSAFEDFEKKDGKMIAQSDALLQAAIDTIIDGKPDLVLIAGDLVNTGERISHEQVASYLSKLEDAGITVVVAPGNHDINNPHACTFVNNVLEPASNISASDFAQIYHKFGFDEAFEKDPGSLSYIAEPVKGIAVLSIDACRYAENDTDAIASGYLSDASKNWIYSQIEKANEKGLTILGVMHHGAAEHFIGQSQAFSSYVMPDWQNIVAQFSKRGMKVVFTGHFHAQDAVSLLTQDGYFYDIETGSLVTYPNSFRNCVLTKDNSLIVTSKSINSLAFDMGGIPLKDYAYASLERAIRENAIPQLVSRFGFSSSQISSLSPLLSEAYLAHVRGDENPSEETLTQLGLLAIDPDKNVRDAAVLMTGLWTDLSPSDNEVLINIH